MRLTRPNSGAYSIKSSPEHKPNPPPPEEFLEWFGSTKFDELYFDTQFKAECQRFLEKYHGKDSSLPYLNDTHNYLLNSNFTRGEISAACNHLKPKKSAGLDSIPPDVFKHCAEELGDTLYHIFNYVLKEGIYPDQWAQGLISPVHKSGDKTDTNNYR